MLSHPLVIHGVTVPMVIGMLTLGFVGWFTSAIVRFAKTLGFSGASPMQRLLRDGLLAKHATLGYGERVRLEYSIPTRGLIGFRNAFLTLTAISSGIPFIAYRAIFALICSLASASVTAGCRMRASFTFNLSRQIWFECEDLLDMISSFMLLRDTNANTYR